MFFDNLQDDAFALTNKDDRNGLGDVAKHKS